MNVFDINGVARIIDRWARIVGQVRGNAVDLNFPTLVKFSFDFGEINYDIPSNINLLYKFTYFNINIYEYHFCLFVNMFYNLIFRRSCMAASIVY